MSYAETLTDERRDFRWAVAADKDGNCTYPYVPIPDIKLKELQKKYEFLKDGSYGIKDVCIQPIIWKSLNLKETSNGSGVYVAKAPIPQHEGRWTGYYINVYFKGDTSQNIFSLMSNGYHVTTKGWTYPNTLPYPDCHGSGCIGRLV
jgi:hypothetical protein